MKRIAAITVYLVMSALGIAVKVLFALAVLSLFVGVGAMVWNDPVAFTLICGGMVGLLGFIAVCFWLHDWADRNRRK